MTGLLLFEFEHPYWLGGSPRHSLKGAKVQRIETMANDIAVGIAMLAAAKKHDHIKRGEQARNASNADHRLKRSFEAAKDAIHFKMPGSSSIAPAHRNVGLTISASRRWRMMVSGT